MSNSHNYFNPRQAPNGTWVMTSVNPRTAQTPCVDVIGDTGKFVGAILAEPDKYQGETFCAATSLYSWEEIIATMSKVTGKPVVYRQMTVEEFKKSFPFDAVVDGVSYAEGFGYWGRDSKVLIAWASENARGKLTTLKGYLEAYPPQLAQTDIIRPCKQASSTVYCGSQHLSVDTFSVIEKACMFPSSRR